MIFKAISASFWIIPRLLWTSHEANVDVINGNASFRARASMAGAVLMAIGSRNNTRRDSTKILLDYIQYFIQNEQDLHCKPECMELLLATICWRFWSCMTSDFDDSFASRRRKRITPVAKSNKFIIHVSITSHHYLYKLFLHWNSL